MLVNNFTIDPGSITRRENMAKKTAEVKDALLEKGKEVTKTVKETSKKVADTATDVAKSAAEKAVEVKKSAAASTKKVAEKAADTANTVKKATKATTKKVADKKAELVSEIYVQYAGREASSDAIIAKITDAYVAEGHRASSIKSLQVYLKPEENAAYYVINKKNAGRIDLF